MTHCENCGSKVFNLGCTNCNEENYIQEQEENTKFEEILDPDANDSSQYMTWQERFDKEFNLAYFYKESSKKEVKDFISQVEKEAEERVQKELTNKVNRVEVIDHTQNDQGRVYVYWNEYDKEDKPDPKVTVELQDEGRTLKVFIR